MDAAVVDPKTVAANSVCPRTLVVDFDDSLKDRLPAVRGAVKHAPVTLAGPQ